MKNEKFYEAVLNGSLCSECLSGKEPFGQKIIRHQCILLFSKSR